jgi:hypothetical protein
MIQNLIGIQDERPLHQFEFIELRKRHEQARAKWHAGCTERMRKLMEQQLLERNNLKAEFAAQEKELNEAFREEREQRLQGKKQEKVEKSVAKKRRRAEPTEHLPDSTNDVNNSDVEEDCNITSPKRNKIKETHEEDIEPIREDNELPPAKYSITIRKKTDDAIVKISVDDQQEANRLYRKTKLSQISRDQVTKELIEMGLETDEE